MSKENGYNGIRPHPTLPFPSPFSSVAKGEGATNAAKIKNIIWGLRVEVQIE
ncbi:MAG: hypothetical protein Kow0042_25660 [Calditrichia bacterium]